MEEMVGRQEEKQILEGLLTSNRSEFVAVYGRRRIGKTFLIRKTYENDMVFYMTGRFDVSMEEQLGNFHATLSKVNTDQKNDTPPVNWFDAFERLKEYLQKRRNKKKVVFFDELPWIDTARSGFLSCLEHFWNSWATQTDDIVLVVCGSSASWMIDKLIHNKGGLHNRLTKRIRLKPFTLKETEAYFKKRKVNLDRYQLLQLYMAFGGVPYYLSEVQPGMSASQAIDYLCFSENGILRDEYNDLYRSLFNNHERHVAIIEALASRPRGLTRDEVIRLSKLGNGGTTTKLLTELEESGFIEKLLPFGKRSKTTLYRLIDQYSLFYHKFIAHSKAKGVTTWMNSMNSAAWKAWSGYAYENIWFWHTQQIRHGLGIAGVYCEFSSWYSKKEGVQIDMVIDRKDHVISLVEIKFSGTAYEISKAYKAQLEKKINAFKQESTTQKTIFFTMLTTFGIKRNTYSTGLVQQELSMHCLFDY